MEIKALFASLEGKGGEGFGEKGRRKWMKWMILKGVEKWLKNNASCLSNSLAEWIHTVAEFDLVLETFVSWKIDGRIVAGGEK